MVRRNRRTGALHGNRFRVGGKAFNVKLTENIRLKDRIQVDSRFNANPRNKSVTLRENLKLNDRIQTGKGFRRQSDTFTNFRQRLDILLAKMRGLENA